MAEVNLDVYMLIFQYDNNDYLSDEVTFHLKKLSSI